MHQLNLFDPLPELETTSKLSSCTVKTLEQHRQAAEDRQRREAHNQLQTHVPQMLRRDGWELWRDPDGYRVFHPHTGLETEANRRKDEAIAQAIQIAAFFELLPDHDLGQIYKDNPLCFQQLPTHLAIAYKNNRLNDRQWLTEYDQRHE